MANEVQVYRATVDPANIPRLLEIRPAALAQARAACPVLVRADLVRLDERTWLDILTWSEPGGVDQLMAVAGELPRGPRGGHWRTGPHHQRGRVPAVVTETPLNDLATAAIDGDRDALTELVQRVQHPLYQLALQFLGHPQDAQDATQEILIRLVTRLATFEGRAQFMTWAYTVATRQLLRTRKRLVESSVRGAQPLAERLDRGLAARDFTTDAAEYRLLCEEVRISCTYGMLLCLTRPMRAAYLLGDVLGLPHTEGAAICDITPTAFRQRLSRARRTIRHVIDNRCGLVNPANPCRCGRQIQSSLDLGILDRDRLALAGHPRRPGDSLQRRRLDTVADQIDTAVAIGELYRADRFAAPAQVWAQLRRACPDLFTDQQETDHG